MIGTNELTINTAASDAVYDIPPDLTITIDHTVFA